MLHAKNNQAPQRITYDNVIKRSSHLDSLFFDSLYSVNFEKMLRVYFEYAGWSKAKRVIEHKIQKFKCKNPDCKNVCLNGFKICTPHVILH
jgi:hypothetical protein